MKKSKASSPLDLDDVLYDARRPRPVPELVRARALSRARKVAQAPVALLEPPRTRRALLAGRAAMAAALVLGVAGVAFALGQNWQSRAPSPPPKSLVAQPPAKAPPRTMAPAVASAPEPEHASQSLPKPTPARVTPRSVTTSGLFDTESELMRRAHSAYAERNFGMALKLASEHARKFPRGVLAEEREALRVRSFAGAGQTADARRAAAAFAQRFPRSVLLSRIQSIAQANAERTAEQHK